MARVSGYGTPVVRRRASLAPRAPLGSPRDGGRHRVIRTTSRSIERLRAGDEDAFMTLVDALAALDAAASPACTCRPGRGRGGRAGRLARRAEGARRVRGTLVAAHLDLPDPHQHRQDAGTARGSQRPVRGAGGRRPRRARAGTRRRSSDPRSEWAGHWSSLPNDWRGLPEDRLEAAETRAVVAAAIAALPPMQAEVIRLRDVAGWTSEEVRNALDLTETNQRVLLHRARAKVRRALDELPRGGRMSTGATWPARTWWSS